VSYAGVFFGESGSVPRRFLHRQENHLTNQIFAAESATGYGRGAGVGRGLTDGPGRAVGDGLAVVVGVALTVAVAVAVAVAVGVGVGEPDCAQYLPPLLLIVFPPQTIISLSVHTAV